MSRGVLCAAEVTGRLKLESGGLHLGQEVGGFPQVDI